MRRVSINSFLEPNSPNVPNRVTIPDGDLRRNSDDTATDRISLTNQLGKSAYSTTTEDSIDSETSETRMDSSRTSEISGNVKEDPVSENQYVLENSESSESIVVDLEMPGMTLRSKASPRKRYMSKKEKDLNDEKKNFKDLVLTIGQNQIQDPDEDFQITKEAIDLLQSESDKILLEMFTSSNAIATAGERDILTPTDIQTARHIQMIMKKYKK
ncbi:Histone H2A/H2B/H3 domain-containing protein [Caenorhabditis elegans]|uniref:Histone H2A/H2B/H3 domain-containing protein n=1 Tax=Caenorhabditis elegans TaxID=6239 RepID=Q23245_CAEEL|nr:Histone H2A/H2B/H3 domain-containing protein [Caenorhabditis elegans]CCD66673.1 Histone H2A/H2B/H3 domain-containing protein [Caenorhabditis elegans]|eukprot:NP_498108.1 Uncharacterized protein CELE_ZC155.2 [Caenorhabditis elegans]